MNPRPVLVSHALCPYVQRAAIVMTEKRVEFERRDVDLAHKPEWFLDISPLGKTPVLLVDGQAIFESAVICEFLDESVPPALHPADPLARARHRAWMELGSNVLNAIAALYNAPNEMAFDQCVQTLRDRFARVETALGGGPFFAGMRFSLVDAAFAPVLRYFDALDRLGVDVLGGLAKVEAWRAALAQRASVRTAVGSDYGERLLDFIAARPSALGRRAREASPTTT